MKIPGSNLLNMAARLISRQAFLYYAFISRSLNNEGVWVPLYAKPIPSKGSTQPVLRNLYQSMGLDFQKDYHFFYVSKDIYDIDRNVSGDQFLFNGKIYQCISKTPWYSVDGWDQVLCVYVPDAVGPC